MKKLLIIGLLCVYGFSSLGMTLHFHFCCGMLKNIEMTAAKEKECGGQMSKGACCEDKQIRSSNAADQEFAFAVVEQTKIFQSPSFTLPELQLPRQFLTKAPPVPKPDISSSSPPLFISNCIFRL